MTPAEMARIHAASFVMPRPWSEAEFVAVLADPLGIALTESQGFLLGRAVAGEAELLTLAVDPAARRQGMAKALVLRFIEAAKTRGADSIFLEVARTNTAAAALYSKCGFAERGSRKGYYQGTAGGKVDALIMVLEI
jgi:ribosomal-protein-alanine N-acetyltransferase